MSLISCLRALLCVNHFAGGRQPLPGFRQFGMARIGIFPKLEEFNSRAGRFRIDFLTAPASGHRYT